MNRSRSRSRSGEKAGKSAVRYRSPYNLRSNLRNIVEAQSPPKPKPVSSPEASSISFLGCYESACEADDELEPLLASWPRIKATTKPTTKPITRPTHVAKSMAKPVAKPVAKPNNQAWLGWLFAITLTALVAYNWAPVKSSTLVTEPLRESEHESESGCDVRRGCYTELSPHVALDVPLNASEGLAAVEISVRTLYDDQFPFHALELAVRVDGLEAGTVRPFAHRYHLSSDEFPWIQLMSTWKQSITSLSAVAAPQTVQVVPQALPSVSGWHPRPSVPPRDGHTTSAQRCFCFKACKC